MLLALVSAALLTNAACLEAGRPAVLAATIVGKVDDNPGGHAPFPYAAARLNKPICIWDARTGERLTVDQLAIEPSASLAQPLSLVGQPVKIEGTVVLEPLRPGAPPVASLRNPQIR